MARTRLSQALADLAKDPIRYVHILGAVFPEVLREAIRMGQLPRLSLQHSAVGYCVSLGLSRS